MKNNLLLTTVISVLLLNANALFAQNTYVKLDLESNTELTNLYCNENLLGSLDIRPNIKLSEGNSDLYCIEVDNEIAGLGYSNWYKDEHTSYSDDWAVNEGEIPDTEYNCLVELYNSTLGEDWTNNTNWLDTVNSSVNDWFGITVENGHVTRIELPNNNMQEGVFENPLQLTELEVINLSGNKLMDANFYSLDSLSNLTSLHIENNNFIFKHIIDIQNLNYFHNFSDNLTYSPQGKIDAEGSVTVNEGNILEIDVAHYWLSENDEFQWYQNGTPIDGETNSFLDLSPASKSDSGTFYLEITNPLVSDLTLQSQNKEVYVNDIVISDIPISEYEALVALYHSTDGENWKYNDNWLDTTNHVINDWYGVTVEDGHVTQIYLDHTNSKGFIPSEFGNLTYLKILHLKYCGLSGSIPVELGNLKKLEYLNLSDNQLGPKFTEGVATPERCIPDELENLESLTYFNIDYNMLMFNDIEAVYSWKNFNNFQFIYHAQDPMNLNYNEVWAEPDEDFTISIGDYLPGASDQYQWYKNNVPITGATNTTLVLNNVQLEDEGGYYCRINNSVATEATITSYKTYLKVNDVHGAGVPLSEYLALKKFYETNNGENWFRNENWLDTITCTVGDWYGIQVKNNHVTMIVMDSCNVTGALPKELADLKNLEEIHFFENYISGSIPGWINKLSKLWYICMAKNNLTGTIPIEIGQLPNLMILELDENNLEGAIPLELKNDTNLYFLSIGKNNLTGSIPSELGNLGALWYLNFEHNSLTGTIPASFGDLVDLRTLDLSHNQLVGPLPVELKNLQNINRFDIDNNFIGQIDLHKSSYITQNLHTGSNRQIPDEMADLLDMDTLQLDGNKLQFNDIEAIFSWENFESFDEFVYAPQDSIGVSATQHALPGENLSLTIDNYFPGPSDRYQWYKNGNIIPGATSAMLNLNALQISDAGKYYCKITNPVATGLTLYSRKITVRVSEDIKGAGVPLSEYNALVAIYNSTNGQAWTNNENWLDTVSHTVSEWFGITVKENHVTGFKMPDNNLSKMHDSLNIRSLTELNVIDLSNGDFEGDIPHFESLSKLDTLKLSGNKFTFKNLAEIIGWSNYDNLKTNFSYSPQADVGEERTLTFQVDDSMKIEIKFYEPEINDHFEWYKNQTIIPDSDVELFTKLVTYEDNNTDFYCKITNQTLPELTLQSELIHIYVTNSMVDSFLLFDLTQVYPQLQTIWDNNVPFSTWPGVTFENGKVTMLDLSGLYLEGDFSSYFTDFDSLKWLDLSKNKLSGEFPGNGAANNSAIKSKESSNQILKYLDISNNKFVFAELEPAFDFFQTIDTFIYAPQSMVGLPFDTTIYKNQPVTFKIANYSAGSIDSYSWSKDGTEMTETDELTFIIQNAAPGDSGYYTCSITNLLFPELTLLSDTSRLNVLIPVGTDDFNNVHFNIYPNPAEKQIFVETGNNPVNLNLFDITGTLLFQKNNFISGWINIEPFSRGIYIVRITSQNSETITKKVIFK